MLRCGPFGTKRAVLEPAEEASAADVGLTAEHNKHGMPPVSSMVLTNSRNDLLSAFAHNVKHER